jgi:hypothetical protein
MRRTRQTTPDDHPDYWLKRRMHEMAEETPIPADSNVAFGRSPPFAASDA